MRGETREETGLAWTAKSRGKGKNRDWIVVRGGWRGALVSSRKGGRPVQGGFNYFGKTRDIAREGGEVEEGYQWVPKTNPFGGKKGGA